MAITLEDQIAAVNLAALDAGWKLGELAEKYGDNPTLTQQSVLDKLQERTLALDAASETLSRLLAMAKAEHDLRAALVLRGDAPNA